MRIADGNMDYKSSSSVVYVNLLDEDEEEEEQENGKQHTHTMKTEAGENKAAAANDSSDRQPTSYDICLSDQPLNLTSTALSSSVVTSHQVAPLYLLKQMSLNGLVDINNKPVYLPPGMQAQLLNLPSVPLPTNSLSNEGEQPLYVNAKQYHRILKRREARAKLEAMGKLPKRRQKYMYESRHRHACKRARACGGKFSNKVTPGCATTVKEKYLGVDKSGLIIISERREPFSAMVTTTTASIEQVLGKLS